MTDRKVLGRTARLMARAAVSGALATVRRGKGAGAPYVSKVGLALDMDGVPLFLLSTLAAHTQDLLVDPRASLLVEAPVTSANPLEAARVTLTGHLVRLARTDDADIRARYLTHHPGAALYADFGDFSFWRMAVDKVHFIAGFGVANWLKAADYLLPSVDLSAVQASFVTNVNGARKDRLAAVIAHHTGRSARGWRVLSVDLDGFVLGGPKGEKARLNFDSPAQDGPGWRRRFARKVKQAG